MKKLIPLFSLIVVVTAFTKKENTATRYAFVTDTEHDKAYDEEAKNGYVNIATKIVSINCELSKYAIESQYIKYYEAEERTTNRERAFIGSSGITSVWIYNSYDEAVASRRDWLAKKGTERKRTIKYFYVCCN